MNILDRLNQFNSESDNIRLYISHIRATLNQLDNIDNENPKTDMEVKEREHRTDDLMVDMFEFIQWIANNYNQGGNAFDLGKELENELLNDFTVSTDILKRKLQRFKDIVKDSLWPFVWDETDFKDFTQSLTDGTLQGQIKKHLLKATLISDFWDRMTWSKDYPYIINGKQLDETRAEQIAKDWRWRLEFFFRQGYDCQLELLNKIEDADKQLNPQPEPSTKQEQTAKRFPITDNEEIKEIFDEAVKRGFMSYTDKGIKWLRGNPLLAYFCVKLSTYLNISEKIYEDNDATNWSYFSGKFLTKRQGGKWELADAVKLHDYKFGNMKGKTEFLPKGYEDIDDLILEFS